MIRFIDFLLALVGLVLLSPVIVVLLVVLGFFDTGSPLFIQKRLGYKQKTFKLIKFRTMRIGSAQVGTHLAKSSDITPLGHFLRKTKLDELPQLINVLLGQMSLVGPRPGLPNQLKLKQERVERGVFDQRPGITGLAQINEVDMSTPRKLSRYDALMCRNLDLCWYFQIILATATGAGQGDRTRNKEAKQ